MKKLSEFLKKLWAKFKSFGKVVKIAMIVAIVALIIAIISAVIYGKSNKYEVLFSDLDSTDAQTIMDSLDKSGDEYEVKGSSIYVDKNKVDQLRLSLASSLSSASKGYELLDESSSFGMTDEEFNMTKIRVIEGELEKNIKSIDVVENCDVKINAASDSVFVSDKKEGSAGVVLSIKDGKTLSEDQVKAIVALISASTSNIPKEKVEIVDQNLNYLTKGLKYDDQNDDGTNASTSVSSDDINDHYQKEADYEQKLVDSINEFLEPVVGKGNITTSVNVDMDFDSTQITEKYIDPTKALVSQQTESSYNALNDGTTSESPVDNNMSNTIEGDNQNTTSKSESQTNNYDHSTTETTKIKAPGEVRRMTVSVFINGKLDDETRQAFENSVKAATGFVDGQDSISVVGMNFDEDANKDAEDQLAALKEEEQVAKRNKIILIAIIVGIVLAAVIVTIIVLIKKRKKPEDEELGEDEEQLLDVTIDDTQEIPQPQIEFTPIDFEVKTEKTHLEEEIKKYAKEKPEQVAEIVKSWLNESEG